MTAPDVAHASAAELDADDELAGLRERFVGAGADLVYFDGNSLGRPLRVTVDRLAGFVRDEWGGRLIRGWDERWYELPLILGDRLGEVVLGASAGQAFVGDSTTVLLYKLLRAAVARQRRVDPRRIEIVVDRDNFPTDRYVAESVAAETGCEVRWVAADPEAGVTVEDLAGVVGERTAVVLLSHVAYKSAHLADAEAITEQVQAAGALVLWDLCHSAGSVPVALDDWGVDLAVGCSYKYLNGGPGAPAFGYVARRWQDELTQPIAGWMGHADPFAMGPTYQPAAGVRRFISGTPPVLAMQPIADMVELVAEAGIERVRAKSQRLVSYAVEAGHELLAPYDVRLASPADPRRRGGHLTWQHPEMRRVVAELWQRDVIPDFRNPDGLRVGLSPLSTSFDEVRRGTEAIATALGRGA